MVFITFEKSWLSNISRVPLFGIKSYNCVQLCRGLFPNIPTDCNNDGRPPYVGVQCLRADSRSNHFQEGSLLLPFEPKPGAKADLRFLCRRPAELECITERLCLDSREWSLTAHSVVWLPLHKHCRQFSFSLSWQWWKGERGLNWKTVDWKVSKKSFW